MLTVGFIDDIIDRSCCEAFAIFDVISFGCESGDNCGKFVDKRTDDCNPLTFCVSHDFMITCTGICAFGFSVIAPSCVGNFSPLLVFCDAVVGSAVLTE